jgi:hypothetical protein
MVQNIPIIFDRRETLNKDGKTDHQNDENEPNDII